MSRLADDVATLKALAMATPEGRAAFVQKREVSRGAKAYTAEELAELARTTIFSWYGAYDVRRLFATLNERAAEIKRLREVVPLVRDLHRSVHEDDRHDEEEEALCKWLDAYDAARAALEGR